MPQGDPVVIRYGTHWVQDLDPNHVDEAVQLIIEHPGCILILKYVSVIVKLL